MWELRRLTTLWAFTACYRDSFYPRIFLVRQMLNYENLSKPMVWLRFKSDIFQIISRNDTRCTAMFHTRRVFYEEENNMGYASL
jgi:hypothetical protein